MTFKLKGLIFFLLTLSWGLFAKEFPQEGGVWMTLNLNPRLQLSQENQDQLKITKEQLKDNQRRWKSRAFPLTEISAFFLMMGFLAHLLGDLTLTFKGKKSPSLPHCWQTSISFGLSFVKTGLVKQGAFTLSFGLRSYLKEVRGILALQETTEEILKEMEGEKTCSKQFEKELRELLFFLDQIKFSPREVDKEVVLQFWEMKSPFIFLASKET